jgi:hypothetical protein
MAFFTRRESARMCFADLKVYGSRHVVGVNYPPPATEPEPPVEDALSAVITPDGKMDWR